MSMKIICDPTLAHLNKIEVWLKEEFEKYHRGFYCNWNIIEKSFTEDRLIIFEIEKESVGFLVWSSYEKRCAEIDIMEIRPDSRNKGYGKTFYGMVEDHFKLEDFIVLELFCSPIESELFWRKMNYSKFPEKLSFRTEPTYYKPLIETNQPSEEIILNKLEMWDLEPYQVEQELPKWTWEIGAEKSPILHPCNSNWNLRLTKNGVTIKEDKVKYFEKSKEIMLGSFLYIDSID